MAELATLIDIHSIVLFEFKPTIEVATINDVRHNCSLPRLWHTACPWLMTELLLRSANGCYLCVHNVYTLRLRSHIFELLPVVETIASKGDR